MAARLAVAVCTCVLCAAAVQFVEDGEQTLASKSHREQVGPMIRPRHLSFAQELRKHKAWSAAHPYVAPPATAPARHPRPPLRPAQSGNYVPPNMEENLACIARHENRSGNPALDHGTSGSASGLFGYVDGTWNNYGGYPRALNAPAEVQWRRAREDYQRGIRQIHQNWPSTSRMCGL